MNNLEFIKNMLNEAENFVKIDDYYYINHKCNNTGKTERIHLKNQIKLENDMIILFNICPHCKTIFYHENFDTRTTW